MPGATLPVRMGPPREQTGSREQTGVHTSRPLEVADIVRAHGDDFFDRYRVPADRRRVLADVARCRTATLGGHVERCDSCPHEKVAYNSCRNRHCPERGSTG